MPDTQPTLILWSSSRASMRDIAAASLAAWHPCERSERCDEDRPVRCCENVGGYIRSAPTGAGKGRTMSRTQPSAVANSRRHQELTDLLQRLRSRWLQHIAWRLIAATSVAVAGLVLFSVIGEEVFEHDSGTLDNGFRNWTIAHQSRWLVLAFTWLTNIGGTLEVLVLTGAVCIWLWRGEARHAAASGLAAPVASIALFNALKLFFGRIRPEGALRYGIGSYAFPSGHATVAMATAGTLAYVLWRERLLPGYWAAVIAALFPLLVGISRTYLDVHWATDVLGGWCVGLFVAGVSVSVYESLRRDLARPLLITTSDVTLV